jgi:endonuclease-3
MDELLTLHSVGRKTANCVLVYAFNQPAIPVDTHVHRISNRLGLVKTKAPEETEEALTSSVPMRYWLELNDLFVRFGQTVCKPIGPRCGECTLRDSCNYYRKVVAPKAKASLSHHV